MSSMIGATFPEEVLAAPAIEPRIARDVAKKALMVAPVAAPAIGLWRGLDAAAGVLLALAVIVAILFVSAALLAGAVRAGPGAVVFAALGGFILRLVVLFALGVAVKAIGWIDFPAFGITLVVAYLGLLFWEMRAISLSLASPGLKPKSRPLKEPQ